MPAFRVPSDLPSATGYGDWGSIPTPTETHLQADSGDRFFSIHTTTISADSPSGWGPLPTDNPNRPDDSTIIPYPAVTPDTLQPTTTQKDSISTAEIVGITVSAVVIVIAVVAAVIWWIRKKGKIGQGFGGSSRGMPDAAEEEEKPPSYEAAVFGIHRDSQPNLLSNFAIPQPFPSSASQPALQTLQTPPPTHHIHSPRPFNAATTNRTFHQFDLDPGPPRTLSHQPSNIIIYPHDSPPPSPEQSALSIRSALQINPSRRSSGILSSYHITDFEEDYPDTVSFISNHTDEGDMNEGETAVREIV